MSLKGYRPVILWVIFIFCLHVIPSHKLPNPPDWNISVDKLVHFFLFMVLSFLIMRQSHAQYKQWVTYKAFWIILTTIFFGLVMETVQIPIPGREFNLVDLMADGLGAIFGCFIFMVLLRLRWT